MLVSQIADELQLTRWGVRRLMDTGQLQWQWLGRFRVADRDHVLALKAERPAIQRRGRPRKAKPPAAPPGPGAD